MWKVELPGYLSPKIADCFIERKVPGGLVLFAQEKREEEGGLWKRRWPSDGNGLQAEEGWCCPSPRPTAGLVAPQEIKNQEGV